MATKDNSKGNVESSPVLITPINVKQFEITIEGITPLVVHRFDAETKAGLGGLDKTGRGKKKQRAPRDPEKEYRNSMYFLTDGVRNGFPTSKIKKAIVFAAHKDLGIPRTTVRAGLFIIPEDGEWLSPITSPDGPKMRDDIVRLASGTPDVRFRAEFPTWEIDLKIEVDLDKLSIDDAINLTERAGYGIGIGEARPEKSDIGWGRFRVKR